MYANAKDRIIVALDVSSIDEAKSIIDDLRDFVGFFKIGLQMIMAVGPPALAKLQRDMELFNLFLDTKLDDIPNTMAMAAREVARHAFPVLNLHATAGSFAMRSVMNKLTHFEKEEGEERPLVWAVTLLTSLNRERLEEMGLNDPDPKVIVRSLALLAHDCGVDGVIASAQEAGMIRQVIPCRDFKIVTPGIRPKWAAKDDQSRITTPKDAISAGADYLVIGRPICKPPESVGSSRLAAELVAEEIEQGLEERS